MPANQFLPFGTATGANVLSFADYSGLADRLTGFTSGTAQSVQLNTVWRQAAFIAAMIGQFTAENSGEDVLDDGDLANLLANFEAAISALPSTGSLIGTHVIISSGTYTPTAGTKSIKVTVIGGGGGGGGTEATSGSEFCAGAGGGAGAAACSVLTTGFSGIAVTVGAGGTGGVGFSGGGEGGTTSFGSLLAATGGTGGAPGAASSTPTSQAAGGGGPRQAATYGMLAVIRGRAP